MKTESVVGETRQKQVRVVEIIGPAGAGKTSLYSALGECPEQILLSNFPNVHKITDAPFFLRYGLQLLPGLVRYSRPGSRAFSRREFAWMSILAGWPSRLQKQIRTCAQVILLDQGPVYLLAEMKEFGPDMLRRPSADEFWQDLFERWAGTLDSIIWLDADDAHLLPRIRGREQEHIVKNESDTAVAEFLACYRRIFETTVSALIACNPDLRVWKFDTGRLSTREIASQVQMRIGRA